MADFLELLYWRVLPHSWQDGVFYIGLGIAAVCLVAGLWDVYRAYVILRSEEP